MFIAVRSVIVCSLVLDMYSIMQYNADCVALVDSVFKVA